MPRESMEKMIGESDQYEVAASISSAELAVTVCRREHIDLILMDVCTYGHKDGIEAAAEVKRVYPEVKIIILTSMAELGYLDRAREAGVDSFWYKDASDESLMDVINRTMAGEQFYPESTPVVQVGDATTKDFTASELRVLRLVCEGLEYNEIAERLNISTNTVKSHVSSMLLKTGYTNRLRLAIAVTQKMLIVPRMFDEE